MILKYALTSQEYVESQHAYRIWMAKRRLVFRNLYVLAVLCLAAATSLLLSGAKWFALVLYIAGLLVVVERTLLWRLRAERSPRGPVRAGESIELGADEDSLGWNSSKGRGDVRWANIEACHETENLLLLQIPGGDGLAIPKRAFPPGEYSRFKELLRKELIVKITRKRSDALLLKFVVTWGMGALVVMALGVGYFDNFLKQLPRANLPNRQGRARTPMPAKSKAASAEQLSGRGMVYLVPIGPIKSASTIATLLKDYSRKYKTAIRLLPEVPLPPWAENTTRSQYVAEDLITAMQAGYPKLAADPEAILIGLTDADTYISALEWNYAFSFRDEERFAIISTAHLSEHEDGETQGGDVTERRLRKVLARDVGSLHFRLQPSRNIRSIMYEFADDASDLDELGDDYLESDAQVRADLHVRQGDPCFILRQYTQPERAHLEPAAVRDCSGSYKERDLETVQIDLRYGLVLDQRTDFLIDDRIPLELTRVLRTQDTRSRAFGVGGNHNLNIFLVGDRWPFTWMDLILAPGGRAHFQRSNWGFGYWDARYDNHDRGNHEFSYSTIQWAGPGWQLTRGPDVYRFPDGGNAQRPEQTALIAIERANGDRLALSRDGAGNLLRAVSPGRHAIVFTYDSASRIKTVEDRDQASDRFVYDYDATGHLSRVTDAHGQVTDYGYDNAGHLNSVKRDGVVLCTFEHEAGDRVRRETLAGGRVYEFAYETGDHGQVSAVDIKDSMGPTRRVHLFTVDYSLDTLSARARYA